MVLWLQLETPERLGEHADRIADGHEDAIVAIRRPCPHWLVYRYGCYLTTAFCQRDACQLLAEPTLAGAPFRLLALVCGCLAWVLAWCCQRSRELADGIDRFFV